VVKFFQPENEKDLADSILSLIMNKEYRDQMSSRAFEYAKMNNWEKKNTIYLNIVRSLLNITT
jgi:glycosyltransferase involved in cell wall biosynthesis